MAGPQPIPSLAFLRERLASHAHVPLTREGFRHAAVLLPLIAVEGDWELLLTRRTGDLPHHRGQIAFPGGSVDEGENCQMAALREAEEEIALDARQVEILGCQEDIWTPSGFIISPVHGVIPEDVTLTANPAEVSRIFRVPLSFFADARNVARQKILFEGKEREVHFYQFDGETIWGATALIIRNFLRIIDMLDEDPAPSRSRSRA